MSSGWPQGQQDLRWPRGPGDDAWPPDEDVRSEEPEPSGATWGSGQWPADPGAADFSAPDLSAAGPGAADPWNAGPGSGAAWGQPDHPVEHAAPQPAGRPAPRRQPEPEPDVDDEYDWYRYLTHGGSPPADNGAGSASPMTGDVDARDGHPARSARTSRKGRNERKSQNERKTPAERKVRKDRKNRGPDPGRRTASPADSGGAASSAGAAASAAGRSMLDREPAGYAYPVPGAADTGPVPADTGPVPAGAGPGQDWRNYRHPADDQPAPADADDGWPGYPAAAGFRPVPAVPGFWPESQLDASLERPNPPDLGYPDLGYPDLGYAAQAYAPPGYERPPADEDAGGHGPASPAPEPSGPPVAAQPTQKRGRKALRSPAARAVRRAAHPDVVERARLVAADGGADQAGLASRPGVAERPARPEQPVRPDQPARPEQPVRPERPERADPPARAQRPSRADRAVRNRKRLRRRVLLLATGAVAAVAVAVALLTGRGGPAHVLVTPARLGAYVKEPHLAKAMDAGQLQQQVITKSAGEAKNVVYAVYEDSTGTTAHSGPPIILFIGGNLTGASPGGFISSFVGESRGGQRTSAGSMAGQAACVPRIPGSVAECAWADNDTFGVVASPTLSVSALAAELRDVRPQVEHLAK
jgi:hypothetical protein